LFSAVGHLHPLIPLARGLADAGCPIVVGTSAAQHATLEAAGLDTVDIGPSYEETSLRLAEVMPEALAVPPWARRAVLFSFIFGKVYAPAVADDLLECARSWRADVVFCGLESLAGPTGRRPARAAADLIQRAVLHLPRDAAPSRPAARLQVWRSRPGDVMGAAAPSRTPVSARSRR
jgi:hypothetical protein